MRGRWLFNNTPCIRMLLTLQYSRFIGAAFGFFLALLPLRAAEVIEADICVYGGTAAGVAAGVQASRMGKSAVVAEFGTHLGGMTSGGLGATDLGNKAAIGGIAREFYHRVARHYANDEAWRFESREDYFKHHAGRNTLSDLNSPDANDVDLSSRMWGRISSS